MSNSPAKHKSSSHHHHRDHHHASSTGATTPKPMITLSFIKIQDNPKVLPKYAAAVSNDCLPMDDLDAIQMELEILLSSVSLRYRALKTDFDYLEDRKHQKKNANKDKESNASKSRKRDEKKSKVSSRHGHTKHSKIKSNSSNSPAHLQPNENHHTDVLPTPSAGSSQPNPKLLFPKNDIPNKFWFSVEPYCMPITQEDVKFLENLLDEYNEPLVPPIPELGTHYALRWTADDLRDEHDKSTKRLSAASNDVTKKSGDKIIDQGVCGPLTQRLVSGLFEEQHSGMHSDMDVQDSNDSCTENNSSSANRASSISSLLKSGIDVEKRLKRELFDLGIFDASDFAKEKEDEVLNEIKRVRTELQAISEFNRDELKQLRTVAKDEIKRLELKRKLDRVDQEVIKAYERASAAKQKRRPLTKHERNEIFRLVEEQKRLSDQLEQLPMPGFNFNLSVASTASAKHPSAPNTPRT
ncbi:transcriptional adapter 3-like [Contarinia nasturtii]|uniref:transcriptional adapter 3-like n=1 Tax=Contarinia nasturtii TaxID=265458 RepID=UPI0012D45403|nr:transcriptional adapter 3-like [Contarinia nasturtii]